MAQQTKLGDFLVTCSAPVNIAVIKYWGKRDEKLILPLNSSLSATLSQDDLRSTTTVLASSALKEDSIMLNGEVQSLSNPRIQNVLIAIKAFAQEQNNEAYEKLKDKRLMMVSVNNFPTAAGLASSASGYCCLVFTLAQLYGLIPSESEQQSKVLSQLSKIARIGSGSACRSLFGGWVKWEMGTSADGNDSLAVPVFSENHWKEMCIMILVVNDKRKKTPSTSGMEDSVKTSKMLMDERVPQIPKRMKQMEDALANKDFHAFSALTMLDSDDMHHVCADTTPKIVYLDDTSRMIQTIVKTFNSVCGSNEIGYTFDAGPNAVLFFEQGNSHKILSVIEHFFPGTEHKPKRPPYATSSSSDDISKYLQAIQQDKISPVANGLRYIIHTTVGDGPRVLDDQQHLIDPETRQPKPPAK